MLLVKTKLDVSHIHGIGLYADDFIAEGTIVWKFNPVIDIWLRKEEIEGLSCAAREQIEKYSYRAQHTGLYALCGDDARFFNHSADPNCFDICHSIEEDLTIARRDIQKGEELTCDYALFDMDLVEGIYKIG
jgi:SET domain-containing protein